MKDKAIDQMNKSFEREQREKKRKQQMKVIQVGHVTDPKEMTKMMTGMSAAFVERQNTRIISKFIECQITIRFKPQKIEKLQLIEDTVIYDPCSDEKKVPELDATGRPRKRAKKKNR